MPTLERQLPQISIIADAELIGALAEDKDLPLTKRKRVRGTTSESERLGFELGSVETSLGTLPPASSLW